MALRVAFSKVLQKSNLAKPLLSNVSPMILRSQPKSQIVPLVPPFEDPSMFSLETMKKYKEVIPIAVITVFGFACELLAILRLALTRDDVRYNKTMASDYVEMREGVPPPRRKMFVFNQKYETPPGLIEALREPTEEELEQMRRGGAGAKVPRRCAIFCDNDAQNPPKPKPTEE